MIKLAEQPDLRTEMGRAARQRIEDQFGWENHITEWESFYASLVNRNKMRFQHPTCMFEIDPSKMDAMDVAIRRFPLRRIP
jgi:hypothetical protein